MTTRSSLIKLPSHADFLVRGIEVPSYVYQQKPFSFNPTGFGTNSDFLKEKFFPESVQLNSYRGFLEDPFEPGIYGVSSAPSDQVALYFAAHLVHKAIECAANRKIQWGRLSGKYDQPILSSEADFIVVQGLSNVTTPHRLELAQDLIDAKRGHAKLVFVLAGEDPVTFFATKLYRPVNQVFFHSSGLVKRKVEVM
jgi:hypothetical protein